MVRTAIIDLATALVAIDSVNPGLDAHGAGEAEAAAFVAGWLGERGFALEIVGSPDRPSVVAVRRGTGSGRTLLINGHLDTVRLADAAQLKPRIDGDSLYGRGAYDTKGSVAAAMVAAASADVAGDVVLALVADEEFGSLGTDQTLAALAGRRIDGAIVMEPTGLALTVTHRGFAWFRLVVEGRAAHGSQPELGVDAIAAALQLADAVRELGRSLADRAPRHPLLGESTVRISTIAGGTDAATIAERCELTIERRTLPGESPAQVRAELESVLADRAAALEVTYSLEEMVSRGPLEAAPGNPVEHAVSGAFEAVTGSPVVRRGDPWWTDAGLVAEAGIPTVVFGVDGGGAHADDEWVDLRSLATLEAVLQETIRAFCA